MLDKYGKILVLRNGVLFYKRLKMCSELPWRHDIASLNYILASNVWQQDHNGFTHQDPGFLDHVANKKADVVRMYLPPDANCLLSCFDHCIKSRNYVNVIVASKHPRQQWLTMEQAVKHCTQGIGIWSWAIAVHTSSRRCRISWWSIASISATTVWICPRSATGSGIKV